MDAILIIYHQRHLVTGRENLMPRHTLAVIDHDVDFRDMMAEVLTDAGYVPRVCADMSTGLACIHNESPDAVLLDLWLNNVIPEPDFTSWSNFKMPSQEPRFRSS
jgi:hypothetical protein